MRASKKKRNELARKKNEYDRKLKSLKKSAKFVSSQMELDLAKPNEMIFSFPIAERADQAQKKRVDRMHEFGKTTGLHVTNDKPKRMEIKILATEITYEVETVTDPETGKSVRASMIDEGPEGFQLTWGAFANLIKMHVGFAIPINRMVAMIGQPEFSSSKIVRAMQYVGESLVGMYLHLADQLSDVAILSGDDTQAKVLDISDTGKPDLICDEIDERLG